MINAFDMPGRQSLMIQMTSQEDLLPAISLNSAIFNGARVVGPAIAGLVVAAFGEGFCFLLNGVSFLAVIGWLPAMRLPEIRGRAGIAVGAAGGRFPVYLGHPRCGGCWR